MAAIEQRRTVRSGAKYTGSVVATFGHALPDSAGEGLHGGIAGGLDQGKQMGAAFGAADAGLDLLDKALADICPHETLVVRGHLRTKRRKRAEIRDDLDGAYHQIVAHRPAQPHFVGRRAGRDLATPLGTIAEGPRIRQVGFDVPQAVVPQIAVADDLSGVRRFARRGRGQGHDVSPEELLERRAVARGNSEAVNEQLTP